MPSAVARQSSDVIHTWLARPPTVDGAAAHRLTVYLLLAAISAVSAFPKRVAAEAARPNVVFILADDLGYGDLSSYGATDIATPNLDRLAREGVRFTEIYAAANTCSPSRAALMN